MPTVKLSKMPTVKLSNYVIDGASYVDIKKQIKDEMNRLESLQQKWSILIDVDWAYNDDGSIYIKNDDSDYDYLDSIEVKSNVSKLKSINGCLVSKDGYLIFAPKNKRTTAITCSSEIIGIQNNFDNWWNIINSKPIRTNFSEFISDNHYSERDPYRAYFEKLLMLYKENIYESVFEGLCNLGFQHIPPKEIFVDKIILSPIIKYEKYGSDVKSKGKYEANLDDSNPKMDDNKKDPYAKDHNDEDHSDDFLLYGEYYQCSHEIVLYVEAMKRSGKTGRDLEDLFLSVLIHEFFHAVHHTYCDKYGNPHSFNENNIIIIESLAASFEHFFCKEILRNNRLISEMEDTWDKHSVLIYPYSGAKQIITSEQNHELLHNLHNILHSQSYYDYMRIRKEVKIQEYFPNKTFDEEMLGNVYILIHKYEESDKNPVYKKVIDLVRDYDVDLERFQRNMNAADKTYEAMKKNGDVCKMPEENERISEAIDVCKMPEENERISEEIDNTTHDTLCYTRSYFLLSLISMEQAQWDLLTRCLNAE